MRGFRFGEVFKKVNHAKNLSSRGFDFGQRSVGLQPRRKHPAARDKNPLVKAEYRLKLHYVCYQIRNFCLVTLILRVHNRFGGMRDLAIFRGDIRNIS